MYELNQLQELIEEHLRKIKFSETPRTLYDPVRYMLQLGGKRIRPLLVLMSCDLFKGDVAKALNPALGVEVFHNFTLLHDDIMDNAPVRRAKETVHIKWNPNVAILSGDAMFVKSCQLVLQTDAEYIKALLDIFTQTALQVCEGQQSDMDFENEETISINDYLTMIGQKTAVLLGCALQMGAIIARANDKDIKTMFEIGYNLGIAFQLQDDLLDLYGAEEKFGKQVGGDIISNKKTFLLLKAKEMADEKTRRELDLLMHDKNMTPQMKVQDVKIIFETLKVASHTEQAIDHFYSKAINLLATITADEERKEPLHSLAKSLRLRVA